MLRGLVDSVFLKEPQVTRPSGGTHDLVENLIWWNLYNAGAPWNRRPPHFADPFGEISELQQHPGARHTLVMRGLVDSVFLKEPQVTRASGGTRDPVES